MAYEILRDGDIIFDADSLPIVEQTVQALLGQAQHRFSTLELIVIEVPSGEEVGRYQGTGSETFRSLKNYFDALSRTHLSIQDVPLDVVRGVLSDMRELMLQELPRYQAEYDYWGPITNIVMEQVFEPHFQRSELGTLGMFAARAYQNRNPSLVNRRTRIQRDVETWGMIDASDAWYHLRYVYFDPASYGLAGDPVPNEGARQ